MVYRRRPLQQTVGLTLVVLLLAGCSRMEAEPTATLALFAPTAVTEPTATSKHGSSAIPTLESAVAPSLTYTPVPTDMPTETPAPTDMPAPTSTPTAFPVPSPTPTDTPVPTPTSTDTPVPTPTPTLSCKLDLEGPTKNLRAIHMGGNWGTNVEQTNTLPSEYFEYLHELNVNWVGISVALHVDDSMDSTVDRKYSGVGIPTFTDEFLTEMLRAFRQHGFCVYLTLAFEAWEAEDAIHPVQRWQLGGPNIPNADPKVLPEFWPWSLDHPDHQSFVAEFWGSYTQQAVHFAQIAEDAEVQMYSLGTETDRLFRSRSGGPWPNHFGKELNSMVAAVREVYSGLLTYDMHASALTNQEWFGWGSDHLWEDLDLDVVGISSYFELVDTPPTTLLEVESLEARWEAIFQEYLIPLHQNNPGRRVLFTEFGYVDSIEAPYFPNADVWENRVFIDMDGNGLDDGQETQANIYQALFNTMDRHPGVVIGAFLWDNWMTTDEEWADTFASMRHMSIRDKLAEDVVRSTYDRWR